MKIIAPSVCILAVSNSPDILGRLEFTGRICYTFEEKITADSAVPFLDRIVRSGCHSDIEHASAAAHIVCDRGVSELVRRRLASFSQESPRCADYSGTRFAWKIMVISLCFRPEGSPDYMLRLDARNLSVTCTGSSLPCSRTRMPLSSGICRNRPGDARNEQATLPCATAATP
ncbi:MAG: FAD-dependent thymidylate synthase [Desulfovibrio sp.]|nr:FAD-dependent thymidylate synthase [Desulfovibrio sp.]